MNFYVEIGPNETLIYGVPKGLERAVFEALVDFTHPLSSDAQALKRATEYFTPEALNTVAESLLAVAQSRSQNRGFTLTLRPRPATAQAPQQIKITKVAVQSTSEPNLVHAVTMHDKKAVHCSCKGFEFRQTCKHLGLAEQGHWVYIIP